MISRWLLPRAGALALVAAVAGPTSASAALESVYRLDKESSFIQGCYPPCKCALFENPSIRGAFTLRLVSLTQFQQTYAVEQVIWTVVEQGVEKVVKAEDVVYTRTQWLGKAPTHQLAGAFSIDGGPLTKFDSGVVIDPNVFPDISIDIADNGFYCYNTAFSVEASVVPKCDVKTFKLTDTTFTEGCYPPCKCPLFAPRKVGGTFDLVKIEDLGTVEEFAVLNVAWSSPALSSGGLGGARAGDTWDGYGNYTLIQGFAGPIHQLEVCLSRNGGALEAFDSGLLNTSPGPAIEIVISKNGMVCFDNVFDITAKPAPSPCAESLD